MLTTRNLPIALATFALCVSSTFAGPLDTAPNAITQGSVPFSSGGNPNLTGNIEYAVFTLADFNADFPGNGYTGAGPLVYAYQVDNTGSDAISLETVGVVNPFSDVGVGDIGDGFIFPSSFGIDGGTGNPQWSFNPGKILQNESSQGLLFSSDRLPDLSGTSVTVNGGSVALATPVPVPGSSMIPEPSSMVLVGLGALGLGVLALRRR